MQIERRIAAAMSVWLFGVALLLAAPPAFAQQAPPIVPGEVKIPELVQNVVNDKLLTDAERTGLRLFHGHFDQLDPDAIDPAEYALATWDLSHPALAPDANDTPVLLRATAAQRRGDYHVVVKLLEADESPTARLMLGRAHAWSGKFDKAIEVLTPLRTAAQNQTLDDAADITAAAEATAELAILEGRPAADYQLVLNEFDRASQQVDRFYWPAHLAAGKLLMAKDNPEQAVKSLHTALALNPGSSRIWFALGRIALRMYDFEAVNRAVFKLRQIHADHVLADVLASEMYLQQRDTDMAKRTLLPALLRYPNHRDLLATSAAAAALTYDDAAARAALDQFDAVSPGHPHALYVTGKYLALTRQYDPAAKILKMAIARQPNWPAPQIELGLLLNQAGHEAEARQVLTQVTKLDPYNIRASNVLKMLEGLAGYKLVETEHFIIKYSDPIDAALAYDMPEKLEEIYDAVTGAFSHRPGRKTLIEIMPNKQWFAVRITGMPDIWTIAACTGPVIALTPPRIGAKQSGTFDWYRVLRHEFVHTVTLDQTNNRIPHWFTEASAVSQEPAPRDYQTCQLLASALLSDELFDLDEINWGFVRPKKPTDRPQAYAQSHWMFEYIVHRFGHDTILKMLKLAREGVAENRIIPEATGQSAEAFMSQFKQWAHGEVKAWGLNPTPGREKLLKELRGSEQNTRQRVTELLKEHPDHPDLLQLAARSAMQRDEDEAAFSLLMRYASARPVDPWADEQIASLAVKLGRPQQAISHLETLDRLDQSTGQHAETLMQIYRKAGQHEQALRAAERVLIRRPYDATMRESAATLALQAGVMDHALRHIKALTAIEPKIVIHLVRLAAIYHKMDRPAEARAAAVEAKKLDPDAPVDRFLAE